MRRRDFLKGTTLAVAGTAFGGTLLSACGTGATGKVSYATKSSLPAYVPFAHMPTPDLPGDSLGVPPGYFSYPTNPVRSVPTPPLSGGSVDIMVMTFYPTPPGPSANPAWQEINKRVGTSINLNIVDTDDYDTKFNALVAGGQLPDIALYDSGSQPDYPAFFAKDAADLTPLLAGDAVKEYPNLAAIPQVYWEACLTGSALYLLPIPRSITAGSGFINGYLWQQVGVTDTESIGGIDDFFTILGELTRPSKNQWALAGYANYAITPFLHIYGVPNDWKVEGGKFIKDYETPEYAEALAAMAKSYKAGYYVPGSVGWTKTQVENEFAAGHATMIYDGLPGMEGYWTSLPAVNPKYYPAAFIAFGANGGKGICYQDNIVFDYVMIKQASTAKVKEMLKVANFFAAPFGTEEYLLTNFGVEGPDYTLDKSGNPIETAKGTLDTYVPWKYVAAPVPAVYDPASQAYVKAYHSTLSTMVPMAVADPTEPLYSPTSGAKGFTLAEYMGNAVNNIVSGRAPVSSWASAVKYWQQNGGDKIRSEYEQAYAESKK